MKIALVFDQLIYGGIERVGINYAKLFVEMGFEVDAYVLNVKTEAIKEELEGICPVKVINFGRTKCADAYWSLAIKKQGGKLVFPFAFYFLKAMIPIYKKVYGSRKEYDLAIAFSGHMNDLTFVAYDFVCAKNKMAWLHGAQYQYRLISPGFFELYRRIRNLICLSELCDGECFEFNKKHYINKNKLYNPIEIASKTVNRDFVNELKQKYGDFALMVARLADDKDQKTAIDAIKYMNETYNMDKVLVLVGDGPNRHQLEQYVEKIEMSDYVIFAGTCSNVEDYYSAADVYVHASPLEGLPTVLLEAMSFKLPIAATDSIPGVREILKENEYGLISPVADSKSLGENMYRLYVDKELRNRLKEAEEHRIKDFSPETIKNRFGEILNEIMNDNVEKRS